MTDHVLVDRRGDGIAVLTFNDPDRRNAMTVDMGEAIRDACGALAQDDGLRAVVLTGAAPAFSAGGDLAMLEDKAQRARDEGLDATDEMIEFYNLFLAVRELPVPTIAAINGHAIGAGLCVALACDIRVIANEAKVGLNFAKLALHPGMGGAWLLPRMLGEQRAAELLYTGRIITGDVAASYGLALDALPTADVLPRAIELAEDIAASAPLVVRQLKETLEAAPTASLTDHLAREARAQAVNYATDDLREGLAAGRERRAPNFTGE